MPVRKGPVVIPEITDETDLFAGALRYANGGIYTFPVNAKTRKPWQTKWQEKSSVDRDQLAEWFIATSDVAIAVHVGRSGLVVFDVDKPSVMPELLQRAIDEAHPIFHASRDTHDGRGHYIFALPPGRMVSNSRGLVVDKGTEPSQKQRTWGEVRGRNGFIIVAPSEHAKEGGHYHYPDGGGEVPLCPDYLLDLLPVSSEEAVDAASDADVNTFFARHASATSSGAAKLKVITEAFGRDAAAGSRHEAMVHAVAWAMREAQDGYFSAADARDQLWVLFRDAMAGEDRPVLSEYHAALSWAVGQALVTPSVVSRAAATNPVASAADRAAAKVIDMRTRKAVDDEDDDQGGAVPTAESAGLQADPVPAPRQRAGEKIKGEHGHFGEVGDPLRAPREYFLDKDAGIEIELLANDILALGPLAYGLDNQWWAYDRGGVWRCQPEAIVGRCTRLLKARYRPAYDRAAHNMVRHHRDVPQLNFHPVEPIMNFTNGLLDWRTGALSQHDPMVRTTIQFPHAYDAEATCPRFDGFLASILEPETIELVWEIIGYMMLAGNPLQVAIMFVGDGGNGKGTVLRVISHLLGEENISSISLDSLNKDKFAPSGLFGKIANIAGDIDATFQETTAAFKMLTGEDTFRGQQKYGQPFDFESWAVPIFSANRIPGSADTSEGYLRRWVVVPFNTRVAPEKRIVGLSDMLLGELPGIAAKGVRSLRNLMRRKGGFQLDTGAVKEAKENFAEEIDRVRQWLADCTRPAATNRETQTVVYKSFQSWVHETGSSPMGAAELHRRLAAAGYEAKKIQGVRYTAGLQVVKHRVDLGTGPGSTMAQRALGDEQ